MLARVFIPENNAVANMEAIRRFLDNLKQKHDLVVNMERAPDIVDPSGRVVWVMSSDDYGNVVRVGTLLTYNIDGASFKEGITDLPDESE